MALPSFLKDKPKEKKSQKGNFREKCSTILNQIKNLSEEKYQELSTIFRKHYDFENIKKKKIIGFYGQLVNEFKKLQSGTFSSINNSTKEIKKQVHATKTQVMKKAKEVTKKVEKVKEEVKEEVKKKVAKKTAKKVEKKTAKKVEKKTAKKVAKKTAKKVAKKTAKKVAKKTAKKKTKKR